MENAKSTFLVSEVKHDVNGVINDVDASRRDPRLEAR